MQESVVSSVPEELTPTGRRRVVAAAWVLLVLVAAMVFVGGYVRLSGSGLSIPHWPFIDKEYNLLPPSDEAGWLKLQAYYHEEMALVNEIPKVPGETELAQFKVMFFIEWSHRALASLIGFSYLWLLIAVWRTAGAWARVGALTVTIGVAIFTQALLGGLVVLKQLFAPKVALHLTVAFGIFALIQWVIMRMNRPTEAGAGARNPLRFWATMVSHATIVQVFLGGLMAGSGAGYTLKTWPRMGDQWIPNGLWASYDNPLLNFANNIVLIQFLHRWWAAVVVVLVLGMVFRSLTLGVSPLARWMLRGIFGIVVLQFIIGIGTLMMGVPVFMGLAHQFIGLMLYGASIVVLYEARNRVVLTEAAQAEAAESAEGSAKEPAHA